MSAAESEELLEKLLITRRFEEKVIDVYEEQSIPELPHSSIGQEAVGVGGCHVLDNNDIVVPSLRTRAAMLLRFPIEQVIAGMFGTKSSPTEGRTTEHHMGSTVRGVLGTTGMVGSHLNTAVGAALGSRHLGRDTVVLVFFGDGATTRGEFHTALNFATLKELPVVFLVENNRQTEMMPLEKIVPVDDLTEFAGHGLPTTIVDGQDVEAVADACSTAVDRARSDAGPTLIEAKTYRFRPHSEATPEIRSQEELEQIRDRDPIDIFRERAIEEERLTPNEADTIDSRVQEKIDEAFEKMADDPLPDEEVMYHVYSDVTPEGGGS